VKRRLHVLEMGLPAAQPGLAAPTSAGRQEALPAAFEAEQLPRLTDARGRAYTYLRLSITDRCDFACVYCMPPAGEDDHAERPELLSFEEIARLCGVLGELGIQRIRFTGGEPLVRRDVVRLIELVERRVPGRKLVMTTNGSRLSELARPLRAVGLSGVNISLDTLNAERFAEITRGGKLSRVLAGLHAALDAGLEVKLNAVLLDRNLDDAGALVDWAWSLGITPRFIELMPLGEAAKLPASSFVSQEQLIRALGARLAPPEQGGYQAREGQGPARYLRAADGSERGVGFITAVSNEFCDSCNRLRITARGEVRACLASRRAVSLRDLMRAGASDAEIAWAVHQALNTKLAGHLFNDASADEHHHVGMSLIGG
jgi:cyclic pyranopterin phosphate synthase